jgi:glycosyltransferase involved in cell wall biosynthesis
MVSTTKLKISVVIPVYNGGEAFRRCLSSLEKATPAADELIVVSDGDTDGSWRMAEEFGANTIRVPNSGGPAKARNLGARAATGDIVFFVDADVEVYPETIALVAEFFRENPDISALIGSYDDDPGAMNFLSQYKNLFHHYTHQAGSEDASTFWGACGAIRRDVFLAMGGFDEKYRFPCVEDIELGYRLKRSGYSIRLCKNIQVKHLKRWEPISLLKAEIFYRALPWTELILRNRALNADLNLSHTNRISVVLVFAMIGMLSISWLLPWLLLPAFCMAIGLLVINIAVYRFFYQKRGLLFTLQVIPWHWFYFLYGGAAFAYGMLCYYLLGKWKLTEMTH